MPRWLALSTALCAMVSPATAWSASIEQDLAAISEAEWLAIDGDLLRERLRVAERCAEIASAAEAGNLRSITILSGVVNTGACGEMDAVRALELADLAAYRGDLRAQTMQAQMVAADGNPEGGEAMLQDPALDRVPLALYLRGHSATTATAERLIGRRPCATGKQPPMRATLRPCRRLAGPIWQSLTAISPKRTA